MSVLMIPVCKTAVPVFLMISGATLLGKTEDYRHLFSRRIGRYVGIVLFWGILQYFRYVRTGKAELSVSGWWSDIYSNPRLETYWYLYLYLGFLLLLLYAGLCMFSSLAVYGNPTRSGFAAERVRPMAERNRPKRQEMRRPATPSRVRMNWVSIRQARR